MSEEKGWRPIETAPRDGTIVDVWLEGEKSDIDFYCDSPVQKSKHIFAGRSAGWHWIGGKWRPKLGLGMSVPIFIEPTHWRPLPDPP